MACVIVAPDPAAAARAAAALLAELIDGRREASPEVHLALAGGGTPRRAYRELATLLPDWTGVHLWFGDERVVPPDDALANARMVREALLDAANIPEERIHRVRTELGAGGACDAYEDELRRTLPRGELGVPVLDIALLGLGEDGHTASLFPASPALHAGRRVCVVVEDAPKPPPIRITLTLPVLNGARARVVLATGSGKSGAVAAALARPDERVPASLLARDDTTFVLDAAAGAAIEEGGTHA